MTGEILVIGALHWDVIVDAPRLPRLDETLFGEQVRYQLGGKGGNQAIAAAQSGADVAFAGRVGSDSAGETMRNQLTEQAIDVSQLTVGAGASGMSVAISNADGNYGAVVVSGENANVDPSRIELAQDTKIVLCQNELPRAVLSYVAERIKMHGAELWLNLAPAAVLPRPIRDAINVLIVNRLEAEDLAGGDRSPAELVRMLAGRFPNAITIVTLGGDGVVFAEPGKEPQHIDTKAVQAARLHGAGDRFIGNLAAARLRGLTWTDAITLAQRETGSFLSGQPR
ncbi:MAG: PfkB family carbohydrate kinase [Pseudomonadota bacterium]